MSVLNILLPLLPILLCTILILIFKKSALFSAIISALFSILLILFNQQLAIGQNGAESVLSKTLILTLNVGLVIISGLYLNAVLREKGIIRNMVALIESIPLGFEIKTLFLILGVLPALESLTGFGVSLFLGVPIFFHLFEREKAYHLSMLGMNIMPWGTIAIPTIMGAALTGYPIAELGTKTAITSFAIFPFIGLISLYVIGQTNLLIRYGFIALIIGLALSSLLYFFNINNLVEIAGVISGTIIALLVYLIFKKQNSDKNNFSKADLFRTLFPYAAIMILVLISRTIPAIGHFLSEAIVLKSGDISYSPLKSPGIILLIVLILVQIKNPVTVLHSAILGRIKHVIPTLFFFILLAQIINQSGMIDIMAEELKEGQHKIFWLVILISPLLAMTSSFITGSNLSGNVLAIKVQQQIGENFDQGILFSALQNSGAGHAVFTSLPIIMLIITIARDLDHQHEKIAVTERNLLKFGLKIFGLIYVILLITLIANYFYHP